MAVVVFVLGVLVVIATVMSAVRTIVVPHGQSASLTRLTFVAMRQVFRICRLPWVRHRERRFAVEALYAPVTLVVLPLVWLSGALVGMSMIYWSLGVRPIRAAIDVAGSTMLTLEASGYSDWPRMAVSFVAAAMTISFFALVLVTYLPSMYQAYASRERQLISLEAVAGSPPDPAEMILRLHEIGGLDQLDDLFVDWKHWFFEARESHTALPAVVFFRSARPERPWVPSIAALLDAAALVNAIRDEEDESAAASLCIRAGAMMLADVAEFFRISVDRDPSPDDPISVERATFAEFYGRLDHSGLCDRDEPDAWNAWRGWRVLYDESISALDEQVRGPRDSRTTSSTPVGSAE